ncbi:MAG: sigma-70 family RNA polymerase sigma factor [Pseudomonadota bacterium]
MEALSQSGCTEKLYREHHQWLRFWIRSRMDCSEKAADIAQDTFLKILAKDLASEIREPRAFLKVMARRAICNQWRREQVERAYLDALTTQEDAVIMSSEEHHLIVETLLEIDSLLCALPRLVKKTFLLAQLEGLKQHEIAASLNISVSTVKRNLKKAAMQIYFSGCRD